MVLVGMAKPGLLLYPTDFIFLSVKCCDNCDRIFINTLLDLKISFIVDPMESVDFLSEMLLIYFGGHTLPALISPTTTSPSYLALMNIQRKLTNYPSPPHTSFNYYWVIIQ